MNKGNKEAKLSRSEHPHVQERSTLNPAVDAVEARRQAEKALEDLRRSEERFAHFMKNLPALAWIKDLQGKYVYANDRALEAFSKSRDELYEKTDDELFPPETASRFKENDGKALGCEAGIQVVEMLEHDDGRLHYSLVNKFPIIGDDEHATLIGGTAFDITERRVAEEKMREREQQLRLITDAMPALISQIDTDYRYRFANHAYYDWFGRSPDEVIGKTMAEVLGEAAFEQLRPHVDGALAGNREVFEAETPYREGGTRFIHATYLPDVAADGRVQGIFVLVLDITERRHVEKTMAHASALIASSDDAIISKDLNGIITSWNEGATRLFGYTADEVIGKPVLILIPDRQLNEEPKILKRIRRGETIEHYETIRQRKDGTQVPISLTVSPIRDSSGTIIGASKIARDITARKESEEALRRNAESFAAMVEHSPLGIYTVDADFCIANVSVGAQPAFRNVRPLIGRHFGEVMRTIWPEEFAAEAVEIFRKVLETGKPYVSPGLTERRIDIGAIESYEWQVNRVTLADGRPGVVCYFFDTTRIQEANEALRIANETLEEKVSERTQELADANTALEVEMTQRVAAEAQRVGLLRKIVTIQEDERMRISRDLHDQFGQGLTALRYHLASISSDEKNNARVEKVTEIASQLDTDVNTLVWQLRPTALDDLGLEGALRSLVSQSSKRFGVDIDFEVLGFERKDMPTEATTAFYRIAQEALNNIHKHAQATRASVILGQTSSAIRLAITDNGCGMTKSRGATRRGIGLKSMQERADLVGGTIEVQSIRGSGTTILATLPIVDTNEKRNSRRSRRRSRDS